MIVKVKEPQPAECATVLTPKHTLFTYLHLAVRQGPG